MKKILAALLSLTLVFVSFTTIQVIAVAETYTENGITYTVNNGKVTLIRASEDLSGNITIPKTVSGCPVTVIGDSAFSHCENITGIVMPDSIESIEHDAFGACSSLISVSIPDSVTSIGDSAFILCKALKKVSIGNGVKSIGNMAFMACESLESVNIENITSIGTEAFRYCWKLKSVILSDNLKTISDYSFAETGIESITIPEKITTIGMSAFYNSDLKSVVIGNNVKRINSGAFDCCYNLSHVTFGKGIETIGEWAFNDCRSLTNITLPNSLKTLEQYAFLDCSGLESVVMPKGVSVGYAAFGAYQASSIEEVIFLGTRTDWENMKYGEENGRFRNPKKLTFAADFGIDGNGNFEDELFFGDKVVFYDNTIYEFSKYTTKQKALDGYDSSMGEQYLKVTSVDSTAISLPLEIGDNGTYLTHFKFLILDSLVPEPEQNANAVFEFKGENCEVSFRTSSAKGTLSSTGKWHSDAWTNKFGNGFVDVYAIIKPTGTGKPSATLSIGQNGGGTYLIDNLVIYNTEEIAPTMLGATFNPTADPEAKEAMYVTRVEIPSYLTLNKISTYMGVTSELTESGHLYDFDNKLENITSATLSAYYYKGIDYITQPGVLTPFRNGDIYATFKGADTANPTIKYSVRTVLSISDAYGNDLGFTIATNNDGLATENGVYSRSLNQIKRLLAKNLMEVSAQNALLAQNMINYSNPNKLYNGPIEQVWAFIVECVNPTSDRIEKPGKFPVIDEEGEDDFI